MKILNKALLSLTVMLSVNLCFAQKANRSIGYTISASIDGLPDSSLAFLIKTNKMRADTVQRVYSKNQGFIFNGILLLEGEMHFIKLDSKKVKITKGKRDWLRIALENTKIKITGNVSSWPEVIVDGSLPTKIYDNYFKALKQLSSEYNEHELQAKNDTIGLLRIQKSSEKLLSDYIRENKNSIIIPLLVEADNFLSLERKESIYINFSPEVKNGFYGRQLKEYIIKEKHGIEVQKKQTLLVIGKRMPDFKISTTEGKERSVLEIASKAEYTLIDFWASWCKPCREAIPKIKNVYKAYYAKGFNVLSISTDKQKSNWQKAMYQEKMPWAQGLDDVDNAGENLFGLAMIPGYILLDRNGIIIQTDYVSGAQNVVIKKASEKTLGSDLKEIIEGLFGEGKKNN